MVIKFKEGQIWRMRNSDFKSQIEDIFEIKYVDHDTLLVYNLWSNEEEFIGTFPRLEINILLEYIDDKTLLADELDFREGVEVISRDKSNIWDGAKIIRIYEEDIALGRENDFSILELGKLEFFKRFIPPNIGKLKSNGYTQGYLEGHSGLRWL
jgi:hypothetical protein